MTATPSHTRGGQVFLERYTMDRDPKSRIPDWGKAQTPQTSIDSHEPNNRRENFSLPGRLT